MSWKSKAMGVGKQAFKNIKSVGWGGEYVGAAAAGALGWGGFSGVTEWAQGGSFWDGATGGAMTGAMMGAGYRGLKVGAHGSQWHGGTMGSTFSTYKNMWNGAPNPRAAQSAGVSKSVVALTAAKNNTNKADFVMHGYGGPSYSRANAAAMRRANRSRRGPAGLLSSNNPIHL